MSRVRISYPAPILLSEKGVELTRYNFQGLAMNKHTGPLIILFGLFLVSGVISYPYVSPFTLGNLWVMRDLNKKLLRVILDNHFSRRERHLARSSLDRISELERLETPHWTEMARTALLTDVKNKKVGEKSALRIDRFLKRHKIRHEWYVRKYHLFSKDGYHLLVRIDLYPAIFI